MDILENTEETRVLHPKIGQENRVFITPKHRCSSFQTHPHTPQTSNLSVGSKALVLVHLNEDPLGIVFQQWNTCGSLFTKLLLELLFLG